MDIENVNLSFEDVVVLERGIVEGITAYTKLIEDLGGPGPTTKAIEYGLNQYKELLTRFTLLFPNGPRNWS